MVVGHAWYVRMDAALSGADRFDWRRMGQLALDIALSTLAVWLLLDANSYDLYRLAPLSTAA